MPSSHQHNCSAVAKLVGTSRLPTKSLVRLGDIAHHVPVSHQARHEARASPLCRICIARMWHHRYGEITMMKSGELKRVAPAFRGGAPAALAVRSDLGAIDSFEYLARRVRNEYLEMPGLSLTLGQAQRMWQLRRTECETLLGALVDSGFLARTSSGAFVRASGRGGA